MKTLNNLLKEYNIEDNNIQPINESVLLICGLFGALAMGFAAIFSSCKDNWKNLPKVSDEDKEKAKENVDKMGDSTKAAYNNVMAEMFYEGRNDKLDKEVEQMQIELNDAEKKGSKKALKVLKSQAKTIKKWIKKEKYKNRSLNLHYFGIVWQKLAKYSEELNDDDGMELGQGLYGLLNNRFPDLTLDTDDVEAFKVYFSQIGINFEEAFKQNEKSLNIIGDLVKEATKHASDKLKGEEQNAGDDDKSQDFTQQTICEYVFKIAIALGPNSKDTTTFDSLLNGDYNQIMAVIMLIGATMVVSNAKHTDDELKLYQDMFNTLKLQISLTGGK